MSRPTSLGISFVVVLYNQRASVRDLYVRIALACSVRNVNFEIIYVDRGSNDGSWEEIAQLSLSDSRIHATRKRLSSSDADALAAAFRVSTGDLVLTLTPGCNEAAIVNGFMDTLDRRGDILSRFDNEPSANVYRRMKSSESRAQEPLSCISGNFYKTPGSPTQSDALWT
ncbi:MAG: glycosyltransferase [Candidatus Methylacidiphilales bacterium]|nr:glycosyltransferase [Candidatus Methylacidiphilales bacterium]